jgi:hypothetical protein
MLKHLEKNKPNRLHSRTKRGSSVLEIEKSFSFSRCCCQRKLSHSFNENFDAKNGITNEELNNQLLEIINSIEL